MNQCPWAWLAVARAVESAGLRAIAAHPVKAEMSGGTPKNLAREPIYVNLVMVCKRREATTERVDVSAERALGSVRSLVCRYNAAETHVGIGDVRAMLMGVFLIAHSGAVANGEGLDEQDLVGQLLGRLKRFTGCSNFLQPTSSRLRRKRGCRSDSQTASNTSNSLISLAFAYGTRWMTASPLPWSLIV